MKKAENKNTRPKVILRRCETYNPDTIRGIVRECFEDLGVPIGNKVLIKPNVVSANRAYIHDSYTQPAVIEGLVNELRARGSGNITVGESSGYAIPPGLFLYEAGYAQLAKRLKIRLVDFNQDASRWTPLERGIIHKGIHAAVSILDADTKIWAPKLKYHICCQVTNSLKLNIGILQHRDRMKYHDDRLNNKIVDLLEIGWPDIVVTDAIRVGHGYESAPQSFQMGLLLISNNPLAADAVAATILGYKPEEVVHLRLASERGNGSISLSDFDISGDVSIEELQKTAAGIESEYQDIHKVDTPIKFYCGNSPERDEFCYGGCLAAIKGCLGTVDKRRPGSVRAAKPGAIVTGVYRGDVVHPGQIVLLVGDCTKVEGKLEAGRVKRLKGCPIGTTQLLIGLPHAFNLPSPLKDFRSSLLFIYFASRHVLKRLFLPFSRR